MQIVRRDASSSRCGWFKAIPVVFCAVLLVIASIQIAQAGQPEIKKHSKAWYAQILDFVLCKQVVGCDASKYPPYLETIYDTVASAYFKDGKVNAVFMYDSITDILAMRNVVVSDAGRKVDLTHYSLRRDGLGNFDLMRLKKILGDCEFLYSHRETPRAYDLAAVFARAFFVECIFLKKIIADEVYKARNEDFRFFEGQRFDVDAWSKLMDVQFQIAKGRYRWACTLINDWKKWGAVQKAVNNLLADKLAHFLRGVVMIKKAMPTCGLTHVARSIDMAAINKRKQLSFESYLYLMRIANYSPGNEQLVERFFKEGADLSPGTNKIFFCWNALRFLQSECRSSGKFCSFSSMPRYELCERMTVNYTTYDLGVIE